MQSLCQIDNRQNINPILPIRNKNSLIKSNNSKASIAQESGYTDRRTTDYSINFDFKYVTEVELQAIVKRVRRARQKKQDEEKWQYFIRSKSSEVAEDSPDDSICESCAVGKVSRRTECDVLQHEDRCKDLLKMEENEVQGTLITPATLGTSIADNIGHAYQLGGVLTKRLQDLVTTVSRMTSLLLSSASTRSAQYEDEDVDRAIKRSIEFDAMFARNHLYEIQRLLKEPKQLATGKFPQNELETKISAALKCVMQALQVYAKNVSKGGRVKYQQVVPIFQSISTIHNLLEQLTGQRVFPFRQELEVSCSYMKQLLLEMSTADTQSIPSVSRKPAKPKPATRHKPSADLSMYNRRRADWRRKTASLARTKFGPPSGKKHQKKSECISEKRNEEKNNAESNDNDLHNHSSKLTHNCHGLMKTSKEINAKEVPYRNATRAVPEDHVTTMMEMIPNELSKVIQPIEDAGLCLDDNTFEALKQLNGSITPLRKELVFELRSDQSVEDLDAADKNYLKRCFSNGTLTLSLNPQSSTNSPIRSKPTTARSDKGEPSNIQFICLREEDNPKPNLTDTDTQAINNSKTKDSITILTIEDQTKTEAEEYHQKMVEYHKTNSHYKDGKAVGIVDRLATRILTEMVMDFQKEEMNNVIQTLYNLEFQ